MKDYYQILGITRSASDEEVKRAYRKLAHQYHPDKSGGDEKKFKEINEAYQTLSNRDRRAQYDRFGTADGFPGGGFGGFNVHTDDFVDLNDIFSAFFEGATGQRRRTYRQGADLEFLQEITLEEAFHGVRKTVTFTTLVPCDACAGKGADLSAGTEQCTTCNGHGEVRETRQTFFGNFAKVRPCDACHGTGEIPKKVCASCKGNGRVRGERRIAIDVRRGIADNQIIKAQGAGEAGERGANAGDLYVRIRIKPHKVFTREGDDLLAAREITPFDILLERDVSVPTIDGSATTVTVPRTITAGESVAIAGAGMPRLSGLGRGKLRITFTITTPKLSRKTRTLLEEVDRENA